ncbi:hypothetical protein RHGRI_018195 [Rhododendron griersonianum]|uniref:Uncharacterized protein n=1 Tax=Rhododendron griersonianum TaxID=479676 RepID=A0AAV6K0I5_9ERIC|nr:hypothetical protein RHGRI_018195 [Rhododendron griersonianum]
MSCFSSKASENALVTQLSRHRAPVTFSILYFVCGMEFNALTPNHLASGADKGCIWDIAKLAEAILIFLLSRGICKIFLTLLARM